MSPLRSEQIVTISYLRSYISLIASPPSVFLFLRPRNQPLSAVYNQIPFPFLFLPSFRVIPPRSVLTRNVFFFPPPPSLLLFLLLPLLANDRSQRPMLIVNRPPSVSLFLLPPSLPSFLSPEVCSGASEPPDGRGGSEKEREKKRNPTSWPKLFSEIRRFFRASSEMIFARINPYGRHGNRSACLVHPRRPKSGKPAARIVEWTRGVRDSNSRFRERALPFFYPIPRIAYLSTSLLPSSTCLYHEIRQRQTHSFAKLSAFVLRLLFSFLFLFRVYVR